MRPDDARQLIAVDFLNTGAPQQWADLGCGNGLFSKALLGLLPARSIVYAIDKQAFIFSEPSIQFIKKDFAKEELLLPLLDGILMANTLHFVQDKLPLLLILKKYLLPGAVFILIEYDTETANRWVPYPLSYTSAIHLFKNAGFESIEKISERQSVYNSAKIYSAYITGRQE